MFHPQKRRSLPSFCSALPRDLYKLLIHSQIFVESGIKAWLDPGKYDHRRLLHCVLSTCNRCAAQSETFGSCALSLMLSVQINPSFNAAQRSAVNAGQKWNIRDYLHHMCLLSRPGICQRAVAYMHLRRRMYKVAGTLWGNPLNCIL